MDLHISKRRNFELERVEVNPGNIEKGEARSTCEQ